MKLIAAEQQKGAVQDPKELLFTALEEMISREAPFIRNKVLAQIEELRNEEPADRNQDTETICTVSDTGCLDPLAEALFYRVLTAIKDEAYSRYEIAMKRFWQKVQDTYGITDQALTLNVTTLQILMVSKDKEKEAFKEKVLNWIRADKEELEEIFEKHGRNSFEGDLALELLGENRHQVIELCNEICSTQDAEFFREIAKDNDLPEPLRALAAAMLWE